MSRRLELNLAGAPEAALHENLRLKVTSAIDIWSLECVFSEAATWIVLGQQGVVDYEKVRRKADPTELGCFHDGAEVLKEVVEWHKRLRETIGSNDPITLSLLDLVDNKVLLKEPSMRLEAKDIYSQLSSIL